MPDAPSADADEFWAFSLAVYSRPAVAAACLRLQDELGLDVNLLLLCCWLARSGRGRLSADDLAAAEARAAPWRRTVVEPLRAIRRALKTMADTASASLYAEIKRLELRAEREEQRKLLAGSLGRRSAGRTVEDDLAANLGLYLACHGHPIGSAAELISAIWSIG
ncbi:MAG TPA: TIGR02444 family protein [Stellaceae bacterium]|jgi:uncharacterized protein (TIGR02444 family)|nr:TIGR02444 family protein [Stellaceae bacterium]